MTTLTSHHSPLTKLSRREWLRLSAVGVVGYSLSGWLENLAAVAAPDRARRRACILLWMNGGPSQMDTFDLKPGHANGGPFKETQTSVPGIRISEHLPKIARHMDRMAIVRSMNTKEADHGRATYLMRTGRAPGGPIQYPPLGSLVAKELERPDDELPSFVSIAPFRFLSPAAYTPGFLGPRYAPLVVGDNQSYFVRQPGQDDAAALKVEDLSPPRDVSSPRAEARIRMLDEMEDEFLAGRASPAALSHRAAYQRAVRMMRSAAAKAFDLDDEPKELRDRYGRTLFGQGCLLARRLVERGVPFVEVTLSAAPGLNGLGWDTHQNNFENVQKLSAVLDTGWSTLMNDLQERGLLDTTLIVWMGEFGRTPKINGQKGRDHWASSWSTVLAGGGIKGGRVVGKTSPDGTKVEERPVAVSDLLATVGLALGLDIKKQNQSNVGRPIRVVEPTAQPIQEVLS
jgi:hypothetical protein